MNLKNACRLQENLDTFQIVGMKFLNVGVARPIMMAFSSGTHCRMYWPSEDLWLHQSDTQMPPFPPISRQSYTHPVHPQCLPILVVAIWKDFTPNWVQFWQNIINYIFPFYYYPIQTSTPFTSVFSSPEMCDRPMYLHLKLIIQMSRLEFSCK